MLRLEEERRELDEKLEQLRKFQLAKTMAPAERKELLQTNIDVVSCEISRLDTLFQELLASRRKQ